jgi:hypothetical protein
MGLSKVSPNHWLNLSVSEQKRRVEECCEFRKRVLALGYSPSQFADLIGVNRVTMASWTRKTYCYPPPVYIERLVSFLEAAPEGLSWWVEKYPLAPPKARGTPFTSLRRPEAAVKKGHVVRSRSR